MHRASRSALSLRSSAESSTLAPAESGWVSSSSPPLCPLSLPPSGGEPLSTHRPQSRPGPVLDDAFGGGAGLSVTHLKNRELGRSGSRALTAQSGRGSSGQGPSWAFHVLAGRDTGVGRGWPWCPVACHPQSSPPVGCQPVTSTLCGAGAGAAGGRYWWPRLMPLIVPDVGGLVRRHRVAPLCLMLGRDLGGSPWDVAP